MGHKPTELERLALQASLLEPATRDLLAAAGIGPGMRVLDVGTGHGDVALLLSECVGPTGQVVAIDNAPASIAAARARVEAHAAKNIEVRLADAFNFGPDAPYDAIISRLVLLHHPDPTGLLKHLASHLRPGGVLVCLEHDFPEPPEGPPPTLLGRLNRWIHLAMDRVKMRKRVASELPALFRAAGLPEPKVREHSVYDCVDREVIYLQMAYVLESMMPLVLRLGVATAEEVGIDTLYERLVEEGDPMAARYAPPMMGAFARVP